MTNPARAAWVYTSTLLAFLAMDAVWIQLIAVPLFKSAIGGIMRPEPQIAAAIARLDAGEGIPYATVKARLRAKLATTAPHPSRS